MPGSSREVSSHPISAARENAPERQEANLPRKTPISSTYMGEIIWNFFEGQPKLPRIIELGRESTLAAREGARHFRPRYCAVTKSRSI